MGTNDYLARKGAKKARKRAARLNGGGFGGDSGPVANGGLKRVRLKKNPIRALCRGHCYRAPELTAEDLRWDDAPDGTTLEDTSLEFVERQQSHQSAGTSQPGSQRQPPPKPRQPRTDSPKKQQGALKLSTAVQLLDPTQAANRSSVSAAALRANKQRASAHPDVSAPTAAVTAHDGAAPAAAAADVPEALQSWPPFVQQFMLEQGFIEPTPIQASCWPLASSGRDVQGVAMPGSGKTLAYLLPGVLKLQALGHSGDTQPESPLLLILLPTRELAAQVAGQCRLLRKLTGLRSACVYGGVPKEMQEELLRGKRPHILAATPGRLLDLVDSGALQLQAVQYLVLDEADKMLAVGWAEQLNRLRSLLLNSAAPVPSTAAAAADPAAPADPTTKKRKKSKTTPADPAAAVATAGGAGPASAPPASSRPQVLLFTATLPDAVVEAAEAWLSPSAERVEARTSAESISRTITQVVQVCAEHKKPAKLLKYLETVRAASVGLRHAPKVLVFANKIHTVRSIADALVKEGLKATMLHGKRSQTERSAAIRDFKSGKAPILVATDVASRGLDVRGLPYVVNYDFPSSLDTYIHRVGRTGRLAAHGHSFSFFTRNLARIAEPLVELLREHGQAIDPNLMALSEAWAVAVAKLGAPADIPPEVADAAGEQEEEEEELDAPLHHGAHVDDLMEGLGSLRPSTAKAPKLSHKGIWGAAAAARGAGEGHDGDDEAAEDDGGDRRRGKGAATAAAPVVADAKVNKRQKTGAEPAATQAPSDSKKKGVKGVSAAQQPAAPAATTAAEAMAGAASAVADFYAAPSFTGARNSFVFKLGPMGLGYYRDRPPKVSSKLLASRRGPIVPHAPAGQLDMEDWDSDDSAIAAVDQGMDSGDSDGGDGEGRRGAKRAARGGRGGRRGGGAGGGGGGGGARGAVGMGGAAAGAEGAGRGRGGKRKAVPGRLRKKLRGTTKA